MKVIDRENLKYEDLKNNLVKGVYFDDLILGKKLLDIRGSLKYNSVLNFRVPEFDYNVGDFEIIQFDSEEELKNSIPELLKEYRRYNCVKICDPNKKISIEDFEKDFENNDFCNMFDSDDVCKIDGILLEHHENFKEYIFKEYFERDLDELLETVRDKEKSPDSDDFENVREDFKDLIEQLRNVRFISEYGRVEDYVDFSDYLENNPEIKELNEIFEENLEMEEEMEM